MAGRRSGLPQGIVRGGGDATNAPVGSRVDIRRAYPSLRGGPLSPPTHALAEELRALGPVRWLVVPNCFHYLGTPAAAAHFHDARVVGPASALSRSKGLRIHVDFHDAGFGEQVPEFEVLPLHGVPFLDETVLDHLPTQTPAGCRHRPVS